MKLKLIFLGMLIHCVISIRSQPLTFSGKVFDENYEVIKGATIILKNSDSGRFINYQLTDSNGRFSIDIHALPPGTYILEVRHMSFQSAQKTVLIPLKKEGDKIQFFLKARTVDLKEVIIHREPPMVMKSDTVQFNAGSFKNAETRKLEDLLKNINGFSVDASGRINYNGKPVEKVLIEGDDISDKGYRMITKNLNADIIEKIEVIDNYNDNRLMRNVSRSGKVGINIKVISGVKDRVSGSVTAGVSAEKRYQAEGSLIYISKKTKLISYGNMNNIAEDAYGNIRYYYEGGSDENGLADDQPYEILSAGSIIPPDISDKYRNDNRDAATAIMSSWKLGAHTNMKTIIGADRLSFLRRNLEQNNTYINDNENWSTVNRLTENAIMHDLIASVSLHRDAKRNHISQISFDLGTTKDQNGFTNMSSGSLVDSLADFFTGKNRFIRFKWIESFMLPGKKVLSAGIAFNTHHQRQLLNNESGRFTALYGIDSTFTTADQWLDKKYHSGEFYIGVNARHKKWQFQAGTQLSILSAAYEAVTQFTDNVYPHSVFDTGFQRMKPWLGQAHVTFNAGRISGKAGFLGFRSLIGLASLFKGNLHYTYPAIKMEFSYAHTITLLKSIQCKITFNNDFNGYNYLYPKGLISGDGTVLNGTDYSGPSRSIGMKAGYYASNVYRHSQWSISISYAGIQNQYNSVLSANPTYTIVGYSTFQPNTIFLCALTGEKFVSMIKSRLGASIFYSGFTTTYAVNNDTGFSVRSACTVEGRWSTGFPLPVNLETKARVTRAAGSWEQQLPNVNRQIRLNAKIKVTTSKRKAFMAFAWNYYALSNETEFHGLDAYIHYGIDKALKISLQCSNLLNSSSIRDSKVQDFSNSSSAFTLVGRYILMRAEIQL